MLNFGNYNLLDQMKLDYSTQPAGESMGMLSPGQGQANGTGGAFGKVLSAGGPVYGAIGGAIDGVLSSGSKVSAPGENRDLGGAVAQGAMKGAMSALFKDAANGVDLGGAEAGSTEAIDNTLYSSLGDTYKMHMAQGEAMAGSPIAGEMTPLNQYPGAVPSNMATGSTMGDVYGFAKDQLKGATRGLIGGDYESMPDKGSFSANFRQGFKGGDASNFIGNLRDGNFGASTGQGVQFAANNYRPPAEDETIRKMRIRY